MAKGLAPTKQGRATFCLNMIVRNEAHVIERCLNSVSPMIDFIRIVDTGSTDDTVHVIRAWAMRHGVNCKVQSSTWVDFSTNRNEALAMAGDCPATHLLLIDADEVLHVTADNARTIRRKLAESEQVLFSIPMINGDNVSTRINVVRNLPERIAYRYPMHEELLLDGDESNSLTMIANTSCYAQGPHVTTPQDGARSQGEGRLERDLQVLTKAYQEDNNPRHLFYMAQIMRVAAHLSQDRELWALIRDTYSAYLRAMVGNYKPHCYVAALWVVRIMEMEGRDWKVVAESYLKVYGMDNGRPEAMAGAAKICFENGDLERAREYAERVDLCRGSNNYGFLETKWYQKAKDILYKLEVAV